MFLIQEFEDWSKHGSSKGKLLLFPEGAPVVERLGWDTYDVAHQMEFEYALFLTWNRKKQSDYLEWLTSYSLPEGQNAKLVNIFRGEAKRFLRLRPKKKLGYASGFMGDCMPSEKTPKNLPEVRKELGEGPLTRYSHSHCVCSESNTIH